MNIYLCVTLSLRNVTISYRHQFQVRVATDNIELDGEPVMCIYPPVLTIFGYVVIAKFTKTVNLIEFPQAV